jgi:hydrogenase nickel incorporation protein HypA/HybF
MHEITIAQGLLEAISAEAAKQNAKPISAKISCGAFDAVNDEALCFAFEAVAKNTPCEGLKLEIEHKPMQGRCKNCNQSFIIDPASIKCPKCSSEDIELLSDTSLLLEQIEFQTET